MSDMDSNSLHIMIRNSNLPAQDKMTLIGLIEDYRQLRTDMQMLSNAMHIREERDVSELSKRVTQLELTMGILKAQAVTQLQLEDYMMQLKSELSRR